MQLRDEESISNPDQAAEIRSILTRTGWSVLDLSKKTGFNAEHLQKALRGTRKLKETSMAALRYAAAHAPGGGASAHPAHGAGRNGGGKGGDGGDGGGNGSGNGSGGGGGAARRDRDLEDKLAAIHQRGDAGAVTLLKKLVNVVYEGIGSGLSMPGSAAQGLGAGVGASVARAGVGAGASGTLKAGAGGMKAAAASAAGAVAETAAAVRAPILKGLPGNFRFLRVFGHIPAGVPDPAAGNLQPDEHVGIPADRFREADFALKVRGESMNAAEPSPINAGDIVLLSLKRRENPPHNAIVAALVDGETCLKRLKRQGAKAYLHSESDDPSFRDIYPVREMEIQGVMVGKV